MTAEDQRAAKADVLLRYTETKERYALLRSKVDSIADTLRRGAEVLKKHPETWEFEGEDASLKGYRDLGILIADIKSTQDELTRLAVLMQEIGLGHVLRD